MKVSELIAELKRMQDQNGDINVKVVSDDYCIGVNSVKFVRDANRNGYERIEIVV